MSANLSCDFEGYLSLSTDQMPNRRALFAYVLFAGLVLLSPRSAPAQTTEAATTGPAVQIFTARNSGTSLPIFSLLERPLNFSVSLSAGYDDNVDTTFSAQDSFYTSLGLNVSYSFGTERTQATLSTNASVAYYENGGEGDGFEYQPNLALSLGVGHGVSERLSLSGNVFVKYSMEPDLAIEASRNRRSGNYFYTAESISAVYLLLERWSTVTSASFSSIQYDDQSIGSFQDRFQYGFSQQVRYLVLPVLTATGEYRLGLVRYDSSGRDSTTYSLLAGADQTLGPRTSGSLRVGAEFRNSDQGNTTAVNPYVDTTLNLTLGDRTSVSFSARYATEESDIIESPSRQTFRTGLSVAYGLTPRIGSSLSAYYRHDMNDESSSIFLTEEASTEDALDISLNLSYSINPRISANAGYNRSEVFSDSNFRSYSRNRYSGGVSVSF